MLGFGALLDMKLNFLELHRAADHLRHRCEYPFNVFDRSPPPRRRRDDRAQANRRRRGACSYTTTIGYGSLLFNDNQALQSFGRLAMSGEVACITTALLLVPALLHAWKRGEAPAPSAQPAPSK
jgi:hypothetical protein